RSSPLLSLRTFRHPSHLPSFPTRRSSDLLCQGNQLTRGFEPRILDMLGERDGRLGIEHALLRRLKRGDAQEAFHLAEHFQVFLRSEEHTSELQSRVDLVCRLLLEKKKAKK